jgi:CubicO group peptidase (beta-lactamase class C family)
MREIGKTLMTAKEHLDQGAGRRTGTRRTAGLRSGAYALAAAAWLCAAPLPSFAQDTAPAAAAAVAPAEAKARVEALIPAFEAMFEKGMADFSVPGAAVGIVVGDELVFAKGYGARTSGGAPVDTATLFQIGSTTKAFLATTLAIMVDDDKLDWGQRVVGLYPGFVLHDPWVTREFRVFDLLAQRSGMRAYVNDSMTFLGFGGDALIHSLRFAEPVSSFRSTFAYVNILHTIAGRIVAEAAGKPDWVSVVQERILSPLGMTRTSATAQAIAADANHAEGHRWTGDAAVAIPFTPFFPYGLGPAGDLNSSIDDMTKWVRMLLARGSFEGKRIVSEAGLRATWTPKVAVNDQQSYAMGWVIQELPEGRVIWHNGGTSGFGAHVGLVPEDDVGIVILSNVENKGFPDLAAMWFYRHLLGEPELDVMTKALESARQKLAADKALYVRPASPRPPPAFDTVVGRYDTQVFGPASIRADGERLVLSLEETGAEVALEPFDGDVFTVRLLPTGGYEALVAQNGDEPAGFGQFLMDAKGRLGSLRLVLDEQPYLLDKADD